jgi:hypothetical protein
MKRHTVILPLVLPRLTDKAAAQFIELLHELMAAIEHHYAKQAHRHRKHQQEIQYRRKSPPSPSTDPLI